MTDYRSLVTKDKARRGGCPVFFLRFSFVPKDECASITLPFGLSLVYDRPAADAAILLFSSTSTSRVALRRDGDVAAKAPLMIYLVESCW